MQAMVDLQSSDAAFASALSELGDALQRVEAFEAKRDDTLRRVEAVEASLLAKDTDLQTAGRGTGELRAKHGFLLREMGMSSARFPV